MTRGTGREERFGLGWVSMRENMKIIGSMGSASMNIRMGIATTGNLITI